MQYAAAPYLFINALSVHICFNSLLIIIAFAHGVTWFLHSNLYLINLYLIVDTSLFLLYTCYIITLTGGVLAGYIH
ncbi:protein of unknown function [Tepidanaerobacter acetatoxydans Re1]|uniref:Uncharacterized protein n=1 Tax=Tepidanaerobacter acetatoxydans (strain DSM 21804 / JCM 16047 / Re1) TaxID=1209989 RepID=L0S6S5_TEPAE|nr:protein of unknown function [Tepidanaerobacter acetatoxydans Re1]